jgi:4-hydroxybenzoate polyprenyltransferase
MSQSETSATEESRASFWRMIRGILVTLRPHQWVKNIFVLAPLFFSKTFLVPEKAALAVAAAFLFCMAAGTVYLFNDLFDIEKDRKHPVKRNRPIPSGQLPVTVAKVAAWTMGIGTVAGSFALGTWTGVVITGYLLMNLAYSTVLKNIAFLDVTIIATGFVLRVLAGAFAIDVFISEWLIACTFFLALYLGLGKRDHELRLFLDGEVKKSRKVLERYRAEHLDFAVLFVAGMTIAVYTIYTLTAALPELTTALPYQPLRSRPTPFTSPWLPMTIPFAVFGITRFYQLINKDSPQSPTDLLLKDRPFLINIFFWGAVMLALALS